MRRDGYCKARVPLKTPLRVRSKIKIALTIVIVVPNYPTLIQLEKLFKITQFSSTFLLNPTFKESYLLYILSQITAMPCFNGGINRQAPIHFGDVCCSISLPSLVQTESTVWLLSTSEPTPSFFR